MEKKMKIVFVLGGICFFGKNLVQILFFKGVKVMLVMWGKISDDFSDWVEWIFFDCVEKDFVIEIIWGRKWDVIFD